MAMGAVQLLMVLSGPAVGSFLALVADRWPRGEQVAAGRSRCRACGAALRPAELIPLASYMLQRGRCSRCAAAIPRAVFWGEVGGLAVGAACAFAVPPGWILATAVLGYALLALALLDSAARWLPLALTLPLAAAGLIASWHAGLLSDGLIGFALGFVALEALRLGYRALAGRDGVGGGDPLLVGAIGAWVGWQGLGPVILFASGGALVAALIVPTCPDRIAFGAWLSVSAFIEWLTGLGAP
ncbi:MAG: prepilin peptidase [Sphingomonadaceae bacterium]|nr:prepilin peptidase [Sphingomonadaceae bacterium]